MTQRSMILSAFLAALVLVVIGGVVANLTGPEPTELAQADPATDADLAGRSAAAERPGESVAFAAREAEYRRLIEEANRRLTAQQRALDAARVEREAAQPPLTPAVAYDDDDEDDEDDDEHERAERWERDDD